MGVTKLTMTAVMMLLAMGSGNAVYARNRATALACGPEALLAPAAGAYLPNKATLSWNGSGSTGCTPVEFWIYAGTAQGNADLVNSGPIAPTVSQFAVNLASRQPGSTSWVRLWTRHDGGAWLFSDRQFEIWTPAAFISPSTGMLRNGLDVTWTGGKGVDAYGMQISVDSLTVYESPRDETSPITVRLSNLPGMGRRATVRISSRSALTGDWGWADTTSQPVDVERQIVMGLQGPGSNGVLLMTGVSAVSGWDGGVISWPQYSALSGEIHPAVGDLDGDGLDELVIGLGKGGNGWMAIFDDRAAGYGNPRFSTPRWIRLSWDSYSRANGAVYPAVYPAVGDVDGDGRAEIVAGLGPGGGGWMEVIDVQESTHTSRWISRRGQATTPSTERLIPPSET